MEHTLNPQGITVNGKSRLTKALLKQTQEAKAIQKAMGAPPRDDAPTTNNPEERTRS